MEAATADPRPPSPRSLEGGGARRLRDRGVELVLASAAAVSVIALLGIFGVLVWNAGQGFFVADGLTAASLTAAERASLSPEELAAFEEAALHQPTIPGFLTGREWNPTAAKPLWGALGMVVSTLLVTVVSMVFAVPLGVGVAAWLAMAAPPRVREVLKPIIELLAAIPSVVVGFVGIIVVAPALASVFGLGHGLNALNGALLLAVMALPTIVSLSEDAITSVPRDYVQASLALGADRWQTLVNVVLPAAGSGIVAACMLGMGRAIGETMTVLMATGNARAFPGSVFDSVRTLTATIAAELGEVPHGSAHYHMLFSVGLVLFVLTFLVNVVADQMLRRGGRG